MTRRNSILALLLAFFATFLVSCGNAANVPPPTYTSDQIAQIQSYADSIQEMRDRMPELDDLILDKEWQRSMVFIRGPLGDLRRAAKQIAFNALPRDRKALDSAATQLFQDLESVDLAVKDRDYYAADSKYQQALRDFDRFLDLVPTEVGS